MDTTGFSVFGDRLRSLREQRGLTREGVAESVGRSADAVGAWEQGRNVPRRSTMLRLAETLGVSVSELDK